MKPSANTNIIWFILCIFLASCATAPEACYTGMKEMEEYDRDRLFDTTANGQEQSIYRPVKYEIYYPSGQRTAAAPLNYGSILDLYEQRLNFQRPADSCRKTSLDIARTIGSYLKLSNPDQLLDVQTPIFRDLPLPEKKLPLIIYVAGMNGGSWENTLLFDSLARAGYVVAAVYSVGKFPGFMSDPADLDEQVRDIMFVKKKMKLLPFIDHSKIGLLSWSMGGSAATKAAMLSNDFKCVLSFDGTEIHYYGNDTSWDRQFDQIKTIPPYIPERISIPYMYMASSRGSPRDSVYVFPQHIHSNEKYYLEMKGAAHESFSSLFSIAKAVQPGLVITDSNHHQRVPALTVTFFNQYLQLKKGVSTGDTIQQMTILKPDLYSTEYPIQRFSER